MVELAVEVIIEIEVEFSFLEVIGVFVWDFGDGQSSSLVSLQYQYSLLGYYQAIFFCIDFVGCIGQGFYDLWVNVVIQVFEFLEGELCLQAMFNLFGQYIDVQFYLFYNSQYMFELLFIFGQVFEWQQ